MRVLWLIAVFGLLFLTSCSAKVHVQNLQGQSVGEIRMTDGTTATIIDTYGKAVGRVRGEVVRNEAGGRVGNLEAQENGQVTIMDVGGKAAGMLKNGTDCYNKDDQLAGKITSEVSASAAAGGCLLLLLQ